MADLPQTFEAELTVKVREVVRSRFAVEDLPGSPQSATILFAGPVSGDRLMDKKISLVGIGASTGGPVAIEEVLSRIPANFPCGILVAIHMPQTFTGPYCERINSSCAITVREALDGDLLKPGVALIAPGGMHTTVVCRGSDFMVKILPVGHYPRLNLVPSVDLMISSMVEASDGAMLGVILTGMGNDGFRGMQMLKRKGGMTIVQDEHTSTVYGMPRVCVEGGVADIVLPLGQIGTEIVRLAEQGAGCE